MSSLNLNSFRYTKNTARNLLPQRPQFKADNLRREDLYKAPELLEAFDIQQEEEEFRARHPKKNYPTKCEFRKIRYCIFHQDINNSFSLTEQFINDKKFFCVGRWYRHPTTHRWTPTHNQVNFPEDIFKELASDIIGHHDTIFLFFGERVINENTTRFEVLKRDEDKYQLQKSYLNKKEGFWYPTTSCVDLTHEALKRLKYILARFHRGDDLGVQIC